MSGKTVVDTIKEDFKKNINQTPTEIFYWFIVSAVILAFGWWLKILGVAFLVAIIVLMGQVFFGINKSSVLMVATLFFIIWTCASQIESVELSYRPYLSIDMLDPVKRVSTTDTFYGNNIILTNKGKIPAFNISTAYYVSTDKDQTNHFGKEWFERELGGYGAVSFVFPESHDQEPGFRSLSPNAEYYYFEVVTTYNGANRNMRYWTHIKKVFFVDQKKHKLYTVYTYGDWDKNEKREAPAISTTDSVIGLLNSIKSKRVKSKS